MRDFFLFLMGVMFALAGTTGCVAVQPWEREYLANEIMQFEANALGSEWHLHIQEVLEGSRGGFSSAGGGCGCR